MGLVQQCARPMVVHNEIIEKELEAVEGTQYVTRESILRRAQEIKGIPLRDIDKTGRLATGKGAIGTVMVVSRVMRKIVYGSGRNLLQGAA